MIIANKPKPEISVQNYNDCKIIASDILSGLTETLSQKDGWRSRNSQRNANYIARQTKKNREALTYIATDMSVEVVSDERISVLDRSVYLARATVAFAVNDAMPLSYVLLRSRAAEDADFWASTFAVTYAHNLVTCAGVVDLSEEALSS